MKGSHLGIKDKVNLRVMLSQRTKVFDRVVCGAYHIFHT